MGVVPPILVCALGEQRKLPSPLIHYFAEPSSDRVLRFTHRRSGATIHLLCPLSGVPRWASTRNHRAARVLST